MLTVENIIYFPHRSIIINRLRGHHSSFALKQHRPKVKRKKTWLKLKRLDGQKQWWRCSGMEECYTGVVVVEEWLRCSAHTRTESSETAKHSECVRMCVCVCTWFKCQESETLTQCFFFSWLDDCNLARLEQGTRILVALSPIVNKRMFDAHRGSKCFRWKTTTSCAQSRSSCVHNSYSVFTKSFFFFPPPHHVMSGAL